MWSVKGPAAMPGSDGERPSGRAARRSWLRIFPGTCFAVLALASPGLLASSAVAARPGAGRAPAITASLLSATAPGRQAADGLGTMDVSPDSVLASAVTTLTFTYTVPTTIKELYGGSFTLTVAPGWTPPALAPGPGHVKASCVQSARVGCKLSVDRQQIKVTGIDLRQGQTLIITYGKTAAPGSATTSTFEASEQSATSGTLTLLAAPPTVTVICEDGTGAMMVSPAAVIAASTRTLIFTYTASGVCGVEGGAVTLTVPQGWTLPAQTPGTAGYTTASLGQQSVSVSGATITVSGVTLGRGQTLIITYGKAAVPGAATTFTFGASEQSTSAGTLAPLAASPLVTVQTHPVTSSQTPSVSATPAPTPTPTLTAPGGGTGGPASGPPVTANAGTMSVSPGTVAASRPGALTFTYAAGANGLAPSGKVTLTVPPGWTRPSQAPGSAGYTTSRPGAPSIHGRRITVTGVTLDPGQALIITYRAAAAPGAAGTFVFPAFERVAAAGPLAALAASPSVIVAGPSGSHLPVLLPLLLILLAAGTAAVLRGVRFLRHRPQPPGATQSVQAVPYTGPPGTVTVQDSGTDATHTVRIEPSRSAAVTTIEETRS
jgi:predicted DNA-binding WGR domain protein